MHIRQLIMMSVCLQNNFILSMFTEEEKPLIDEDIEVKRMRRLEQLRARRPYHAISEDGSGWVPLSPKHVKSNNLNDDMSPPRKQRIRNDTPSPEPELDPSTSNREDADLSPPRQRLKRYDSLSPERGSMPAHSKGKDSDISPPRKQRAQIPTREHQPLDSKVDDTDLSPPRQRRKGNCIPFLELDNILLKQLILMLTFFLLAVLIL